MCSSCGGTCGSKSAKRARTTIDVTINGKVVFVRDGRQKLDRMPFRAATRDTAIISGRLEDTPEGFLICRDVPIARTGEQTYLSFELPNIPALNGRVTAVREPEHVFDQAAIESFRGKPLTDDHPPDDVTPRNYRDHIIGVVQNPRRGQGQFLNHLVGDLMVYDPDAIQKIKSGQKRELSCGYDADYQVISPGRARQINIRGNHLSLVDEGRCGPTCAIHH